MAATHDDISGWFDDGIQQDKSYMIVLCDTFDYSDYPIYADTANDCMFKFRNPGSMQRVMEVYDLKADKKAQMNALRAFNLPKDQ